MIAAFPHAHPLSAAGLGMTTWKLYHTPPTLYKQTKSLPFSHLSLPEKIYPALSGRPGIPAPPVKTTS